MDDSNRVPAVGEGNDEWLDVTDAAEVGRAFCNILYFWDDLVGKDGLRPVIDSLTSLIHPWWWVAQEIVDSVETMAAIDRPGWGSDPREAVGAPWLRYMTVLDGVDESFSVADAEVVGAAAIVSLCWMKDQGRWGVVGFGDYVRPEQLTTPPQ